MKDVKAVGSLLIWEEDSWPHDICTAGGGGATEGRRGLVVAPLMWAALTAQVWRRTSTFIKKTARHD